MRRIGRRRAELFVCGLGEELGCPQAPELPKTTTAAAAFYRARQLLPALNPVFTHFLLFVGSDLACASELSSSELGYDTRATAGRFMDEHQYLDDGGRERQMITLTPVLRRSPVHL